MLPADGQPHLTTNLEPVVGCDRFRKEFMVQEGIHFFVWYLQFMWMYRAFCCEFKAPIEALKSGKEP